MLSSGLRTAQRWARRPLWAGLLILVSATAAEAQRNEPTPDSAPGKADPLILDQEQVADRFRRFEDVLLRMAELTAADDPDRAALLRKAIAASKDQLLTLEFQRLVELLKDGRLANATRGQQEMLAELKKLLDLLLSEDRQKELERKQARVRDMLKDVEQIIRKQRSLRARTDGREDPAGLADEQGELAEETGELSEPPGDENSDSSGEPGESENSKPSESPPGDGEIEQPGGEPMPSSGDPQSGDPQQGQQQGQPGQPSEPGQPSPTPGGQQPPEGEQAARDRLAQAEQRMREAQEKLEEAQRDQAADRQEEALRELEQAKAELEEVLRQLREEELKRMLARLEGRFRKMLKMQIEVLDGTRALAEIPEDQRDRTVEIQAGRLGRSESLIDVEADKALVLLREEGSAVALPEAVEQMREDIQQVVVRLAEVKIDDLTLAIEEDIVTALEEIIGALQQAQQDLEQQQQQSQPPPQGAPPEPALIDQLAELRMIRALQMRVNRRTQRYTELIDGEQAENEEYLQALDQLADRQQRIFRATRDIVSGRNR